MHRSVLLTLASVTVSAAVGLPSAAADGTAALAPDGRTLAVGAVVTTGTRSGDLCTFVNDHVTLVATAGADAGITLRADDACRLVVTSLGAVRADAPAIEAPRYTEPRGYDGSAPAETGAPFDADAADDPATLPAEVVATATSTEVVDVQTVQLVLNEAGVQEYRDYTAAQYVRNRRTRTVGALALTDGSCEGSYIDEYVLYGPYANRPLTCFFKPTYNGSARVGFVSGGTYRKAVATITIDQRKLTETSEATYGGTTRSVCSTGGTLRTGWSSVCYFDVN
ncbi:MAG TPA: hypothetical protein VFQ85_13440 [Mycobacteriales bacterium]|nr:hypothetical protein [Mycobacteriales bacterium]